MSQQIQHAANAQWSSILQPPLVDSVSCNCKINKVVRRSRRNKISCKEVESPLIPGLLDDLAITCLIRVPRVDLMKLPLVCKRWNCLLSENLFYSLRKSHGFEEGWVYVIKRYYGRNLLHAFDPIYRRWESLPPIPWEFSEATMFGCEVLSGCHLYLFGGIDASDKLIRSVIFYCARTNKWRRVANMPLKCHCLRFRSCVVNNRLYVVGFGCKEINKNLRFAVVYDPNQNKWNIISDMSTTTYQPFRGFVHNGTWFLEVYGSNHNVIWETYAAETDTWSSPVTNEIVNGWNDRLFCTSLNGQLYALEYFYKSGPNISDSNLVPYSLQELMDEIARPVSDSRLGWRLTVYDSTTDSWKELMDCTLHWRTIHGCVIELFPLNGKLCIIYNNMSFSLIDVSSINEQVESNHYIWENIVGESSTSSIIYCKVMEV